ncbi:MAG: response regulator [Flavobacteriaceae bacterium]|nr:response regulator [Flavobacteriaceae bacterium]
MDLKVLIVEDDVVFCKLLTKYLKNNGIQTKDAQTAETAKALLKGENFDFIVIDNKLPDEDGIEVLEWMSQEKISIKKILMSRFEDEKIIQRATDIGVKRFVKKPLKPTALLDLLQELG